MHQYSSHYSVLLFRRFRNLNEQSQLESRYFLRPCNLYYLLPSSNYYLLPSYV